MEYLIAYAVVAAAISLHSIIDIVWPVLRDALASVEDPSEHTLLADIKLTLFLVFIVNVIVAPLWIPVLLIPEYRVAATIGMRASVLDY